MNLKKVKTKDIECHSCAVEAFNFDMAIKRQYTLGFFNSNLLKQIYTFEFPVVIECEIENGSNKYLLISNWNKLINDENTGTLTVCNYKLPLSNYEVTKLSWLYVISKQLPKWKYCSDIKSLNDFLDQIPESILSELITHHHTKSKVTLISKLTGKSDTAIRYQIKSSNHNTNMLIKND